MKPNPQIDAYIAQFPESIQKQLQLLRSIIQKSAPHSEEVISYSMPAYKCKSVLVYFAGYKNHIGFYPTSSGIVQFQNEFEKSGYKWSKGAVQFPVDKPLPVKLIERIVSFRLKEMGV